MIVSFDPKRFTGEMNRGANVLQSSPLHQQMLTGGPNSWWPMMATTRPPPPVPLPSQPYFFPHPLSSSSPWHHDNQDFPDSLSQLLMSGLAGDDDHKPAALSHMQQLNKLENWEEQLLLDHHHHHHHYNSSSVNSIESSLKQETNTLNYGSSSSFGHEFHGFKQNNNWSANQMIPVSSPSSCITSLSNNILDFSTTISSKRDGRHPPPDRSSECNSSAATGGVSKKAKIQGSSNQTTFKVRKEKLGDRITALHQLVSPFGKTDTASVLLEAIGYIRFLQSQIEALSIPYLDNRSGNMRNQLPTAQQGERNCLFPEDPGQLLNDSSMKMKGSTRHQQDNGDEEAKKKDLRSRGLCLVPVSCSMQVGSDNGADYWAPAGFR